MGLFSRRRRDQVTQQSAQRSFGIDRGVPDLARPTHALLHVLDHDVVLVQRGKLTVDVEPVGAEPYRTTLFHDLDVDIVSEIVVGTTVPGIVDLDAPDHVVLLEPAGGVDLPMVEPELAQARLDRDARTVELGRRYPTPSVAQLRGELSPGSRVSAHEAARFRLRLLTLLEARELGARATEDPAWMQASNRLSGQRVGMDTRVIHDAAESIGHIRHVAPGGRDLDEQIPMNMLLSIWQSENSGADPALVATVLAPWEQVLGPIG